MNNQTTKTLNAFPEDKIKLRLSALEFVKNKQNLSVLDCFHGYGKLWGEIKKRSGMNINLLGIEIDREKKSSFPVVYGDNKKLIPSLDLSKYNIIDIDSFGDSYSHIKSIYNKIEPGTIVIYTHITVNMGSMSKDVIKDVIGEKIYSRCKTIFRSRFVDIFEAALYQLGIHEVIQMQKNNKIYGFFIK